MLGSKEKCGGCTPVGPNGNGPGIKPGIGPYFPAIWPNGPNGPGIEPNGGGGKATP